MKKLFIFLFFTANILFAQDDFEGVLKFKIDFKDKTGRMSDEENKQFMGTELMYYVKKNKYKTTLNGLLNITQYYDGKDSLFTKMSVNDKLMYKLASENDEKIISHSFEETDYKILDLKCELLVVKTDKGIHKYYFNSTIRNNPKYYQNHKYGLYNFLSKITKGAIALRSEVDIDKLYSSTELISVDRKKLNDSIFVRPRLEIIPTPR